MYGASTQSAEKRPLATSISHYRSQVLPISMCVKRLISHPMNCSTSRNQFYIGSLKSRLKSLLFCTNGDYDFLFSIDEKIIVREENFILDQRRQTYTAILKKRTETTSQRHKNILYEGLLFAGSLFNLQSSSNLIGENSEHQSCIIIISSFLSSDPKLMFLVVLFF